MPYDVPHTVSPGLWTLAWRRLRVDRVAMVSLAIVVAFLVMVLLSATGLIAKDWAKEVGVNYAPPSFLGPVEPAAGAAGAPTSESAPPGADQPTELPVQDPLADALAAIRGGAGAPPNAGAGETSAEGKTVDPLADVMADIRS